MNNKINYKMSSTEITVIKDNLALLNDFEQSMMESLEGYDFTVVSEKQLAIVDKILAKCGYQPKREKPDTQWLSKRIDVLEAKLDQIIRLLNK